MLRNLLISGLSVFLLTVTAGCVSLNPEGPKKRSDNAPRTNVSARSTSSGTAPRSSSTSRTRSSGEIFDPLPEPSDTTNIRVKPGDVLSISVNDEDWGENLRIPPSGILDFRFIGPVRLMGLTLVEIEDQLRQQLHPDYLINPQITVNFEKISPVRVLVMGQVGRPSHVEIDRGEGIMDALVEANSLTRNSVRTKMYVFRKTNQDTAVYRVNYEKYARGDLRQNIPLRDGDLVYVRTHFWPHFDRLQDVLQTVGFAAGTAGRVQETEVRNQR